MQPERGGDSLMRPTDSALRSEDVPGNADTSAAPGTNGISLPTGGIAERWLRLYRASLFCTDALAIIWVVFGTQIAWLGLDARIATTGSSIEIQYTIASATLIVLWLAALTLNDSRGFRVSGVGVEEYRRVISASFTLFGCIAIAAYLFQWQIARGYLLVALPAGVLVLLLTRWMWRQWLGAKRERGEFSRRVLLVGSVSSARHIAHELARTPSAGYQVIAACVPSTQPRAELPGTKIPVLGDFDSIPTALERTGADTVVITSTDDLPPERVKEISWALEQGKQHLVVAPSLTDIAGPRIHTRPVAGLPLIHVETPNLSPGQRIVKRATDLVLGGLLAVLFSPVMLVLAIIVKATSPGPVLYRQERIGRKGQPFAMLKFRSMRTGADKELQALLQAQGTAQQPLFKVRDDPRITPVGRVLRKYSLDELPQLFNVLDGSMSLVGPRPQIAAEVALYSDAHRRRLLVRPGITGLWQVSGRSSLTWEQAVRLDLYYVENWSFLGDLLILFKTVKAVLSPGQTAH